MWIRSQESAFHVRISFSSMADNVPIPDVPLMMKMEDANSVSRTILLSKSTVFLQTVASTMLSHTPAPNAPWGTQ